ncbi:hypothetical protein INT43_005795 [Umbelopsis isabellina]|uniref:Zinc-finger domain-containing protein n=1 Tax=Mortierella isabellina TaxID=91625 RepID=A0A8H7PIQ3_MORIS|nr:hypothetical protein INT43_005795 [Umbelopsis isabellina]
MVTMTCEEHHNLPTTPHPFPYTRLPFSVRPPATQSKDQRSSNATADTDITLTEKTIPKQTDSENDLSESVNSLTFESKPTKPIKDIKLNDMIRCTAITKGDQQCDLLYCWKCLLVHYNESPESVEQAQGVYLTAEGQAINHASGQDVTWACPKCRDICTCKGCSKARERRKNVGSRFIMSSFIKQQYKSVLFLPQKDASLPTPATNLTRRVTPPTFVDLDLKYDEELIWQRLQIREFIFRFEHLLALGPDDREQLQDAQADWVENAMLKKLAVSMLELIAIHGIEITGVNQAVSFQNQVVQFLDDEHISSSRPYLNRKHWQTLTTLLCDAGYEQVPICADEADPIVEKSDVQMDWLPSFVTRSMHSNGTGPMSLANHGLDQLKILNMLSECALCTPCIRKDVVHGSEQIKEEENSLQTEKRQNMYDDMHARTTRKNLLRRLDEATTEDQIQIQEELEQLENESDERRKRLYKKEIDLYLANQRSSKRSGFAGTDQHGNEYWVFGDLVPNKAVHEGVEDCWGRGVIIVGPGICEGHGSQQREEDKPCVAMLTTNRRWWYLSGIENIDRLINWLTTQCEAKDLLRQLSSRSRYVQTLSKLHETT